jgi:hypothetical protein
MIVFPHTFWLTLGPATPGNGRTLLISNHHMIGQP